MIVLLVITNKTPVELPLRHDRPGFDRQVSGSLKS